MIGMIVFGFAVAHPFLCTATEVESIDIIDYGLYKTMFVEYQAAPHTARGKIQLVEKTELVQTTNRIPGKTGAEFGIRYIVNGSKKGEHVNVHVKVLHSETKNTNEWVISRQVGTPHFDGWKFNANSKIAPGKWTIQLFHDGTKLAEKRFNVYEL